MSARPGLCGGHRVTGVPTAIANNHFSSLCLRTEGNLLHPHHGTGPVGPGRALVGRGA